MAVSLLTCIIYPGSGIIYVKAGNKNIMVNMVGQPSDLDAFKNAVKEATGGIVEFNGDNKLTITGGTNIATISGTDAATSQFIKELLELIIIHSAPK